MGDIDAVRSRIARLLEHVRRFFYVVVLSPHRCPLCGGSLVMEREGLARCDGCGAPLDPTVEFQCCPTCEGRLKLRVCRYACSKCGQDVASRFLFDGKVFDAEYFRRKMAESRKRQGRQQSQAVRSSPSGPVDAVLPGPADLSQVPGLAEALDMLTGRPDREWIRQARESFGLDDYESHVLAHVKAEPVELAQLPPMTDRGRADRIWIFIAVIFLSHARTLDVRQQGDAILVMRRETDREGQAISGNTETADGFQRTVGRAQA